MRLCNKLEILLIIMLKFNVKDALDILVHSISQYKSNLKDVEVILAYPIILSAVILVLIV